MPDQPVYRCVSNHSGLPRHHHSRRVGADRPWDGGNGQITHSPGPHPPVGWERHRAPDGTDYLFHTSDFTVDGQPSETPVYRCANDACTAPGDRVHTHGLYVNDHTFHTWGNPSETPPENITRQLGADGQQLLFSKTTPTVDWEPPRDRHLTEADLPAPEPETFEVRENAAHTIHLTTDESSMSPTTICGERIAWKVSYSPREWRGPRGVTLTECSACFPATEAVTPAPDRVLLCEETHRSGAPETHYHVRSVTGGDVQWHSTPGWGAAHPSLYTDIPGTFTTRHELVTPTERESTMPDTFTPGDIVVATGGRHHNITADHLHLIAGPMQGDPAWSATVLSLGNEGHGWAYRGRTEGLTREVASVLREESARGWNIDNLNLRLATEAEQRHLPRDMELLQRRIRVAALGFEPVQECTNGACDATPHRHSITGMNSSTVMHRLPGDDSIYIPLPGLWGKGSHVTTTTTTTTEETTTMYDLRMNGDTVIHQSRARAVAGEQAVAVCGTVISRAVRFPPGVAGRPAHHPHPLHGVRRSSPSVTSS